MALKKKFKKLGKQVTRSLKDVSGETAAKEQKKAQLEQLSLIKMQRQAEGLRLAEEEDEAARRRYRTRRRARSLLAN